MDSLHDYLKCPICDELLDNEYALAEHIAFRHEDELAEADLRLNDLPDMVWGLLNDEY